MRRIRVGLLLVVAASLVVASYFAWLRRPDLSFGGELVYVKMLPSGRLRVFEVQEPYDTVSERAIQRLRPTSFGLTSRSVHLTAFDGPVNHVRIWPGEFVDFDFSIPDDPVPTKQPVEGVTTVVVFDDPNPAWRRRFFGQ